MNAPKALIELAEKYNDIEWLKQLTEYSEYEINEKQYKDCLDAMAEHTLKQVGKEEYLPALIQYAKATLNWRDEALFDNIRDNCKGKSYNHYYVIKNVQYAIKNGMV